MDIDPLVKVHSTLIETLIYIEAFQRLGFEPQEVKVFYDVPTGYVHVIVRRAGLEFDAKVVGQRLHVGQEHFEVSWNVARDLWDSCSRERRVKAWIDSFMGTGQNFRHLYDSMRAKGFVITRLREGFL